jgi:hypothetical protein
MAGLISCLVWECTFLFLLSARNIIYYDLVDEPTTIQKHPQAKKMIEDFNKETCPTMVNYT